MTHDPLCPRPDCDYGEPDGECMGYEDCWHRCVCDVIARVRADERSKVERVIYRTCGHTKYVGCEPCWHDVMVKAIRGEARDG